LFAIDHGIGEVFNVTGCFPHARVHEDRRIEALDVVAQRHLLPPCILDITQKLHAERAVVPGAVEPAVNFRGLKHKPAPLSERNEFFHDL
jgi:hypothetical protein